MAAGSIERVEHALGALASDHGLELWSVELGGAAKRPVVRVFLDKPGGISLDEISDANRWIGDALDELGTPAGAYVLEVSSPGIDRTLRGPADYVRYLGERAEVKLREPSEGRKTFTGRILAAEEDAFVLDVEGAQVRIPYHDVSKARLRADFDFSHEESEGKR